MGSEMCIRDRCWRAVLTALLYMAAIIIVLFCDTRAELHSHRPSTSMWGYLKSWIKQAAFYHFICELLHGILTLVWGTLTTLWSWVPPLSKPRGPPDPHAARRRRYKEALMYHTRTKRPRSHRCARILMAALTLSKWRGTAAFSHPDAQHLSEIISPPSTPTPVDDYFDAMSCLLINATEAADPDLHCMSACQMFDLSLIHI